MLLSSGVPETVTTGFNELVEYFWNAQKHYLIARGTIAYYPGFPSIYGSRNDGIEGVTRLLPLWAAYTTSSEAKSILENAIVEHLRRAILNGTNPGSNGYWGDIEDKGTLICEAADIALALWIGKHGFWKSLNPDNQKQILAWLRQAVGKETADNNWHLFVILVDLVVCDLEPDYTFESEARYARIKSFYLGDGCFKDGPAGGVDLYNAWGFHYSLFWINQISPGFDSEFIDDALAAYCAWYQYSFTSDGVLLYGRSLPYRTATPCPLLAATLMAHSPITKDIAFTATVACWEYFITRGAVENGKLTQGVFEDNLKWTDPYSGPASSFWGIRSLVLFYYLARNDYWKSVTKVKLPSETSKVDITIPAAGFRLVSYASAKLVTLTVERSEKSIDEVEVRGPSFRDKLRQLFYASASRESNNLLAKGVRLFDSRLDIYRH